MATKKSEKVFIGNKLAESGGLILVAGKQGSGKTPALQNILEPYTHGDIAKFSIVDTRDGLEWFEISGQTEHFLVGEDLLAIHDLLNEKAALVGVQERIGSGALDMVVIDEIVELFDEGERTDAELILIRAMKASILKIANAGKLYGVVLILTTEKPAAVILPVWRNLADLAIAFRLVSEESEIAILGPASETDPLAVDIPDRAKGVAVVLDRVEGTREFVRF